MRDSAVARLQHEIIISVRMLHKGRALPLSNGNIYRLRGFFSTGAENAAVLICRRRPVVLGCCSGSGLCRRAASVATPEGRSCQSACTSACTCPTAGSSGACAGGPQLVGHAGRRLQRRKRHVQCHGGTGSIFLFAPTIAGYSGIARHQYGNAVFVQGQSLELHGWWVLGLQRPTG